MKKQLICLLSFVICTTSVMQAQSYSFRKLAEVGELFPAACLPPADSVFLCPQITKGKSFIVKYNGNNEISHLGVSLFSPESKEMINLPVCDFIERMMLELLLQKTPGDVRSKLREYKISLTRNGVEYGKGYFTSLTRMLEDVQSPTRFGIQKDSAYTAVWNFGNNERLTLSFPASRELIFGTDKKESDQNIGEQFDRDNCRPAERKHPEISRSSMTAMNGSDLYLQRGDTFLIGKINSNTYYQRSDGQYQLAFNREYPTESLANVFIAKQTDNSLTLKISHRMYGGFTPEFTAPLNRFLCLFDAEFSTYCVLNRSKSGNIQLSVVLYNWNYNYVHLLRIKATAKQLFDTGILPADLYTNIPLHNLKSLF